MANLKEIRTRIASVTSTRQITSAMKMVAAAKLRKAQGVVAKIKPYADKMGEMLKVLSETLAEDSDSVFTAQRPVNKMLVVAISSNKGLCGAFNSNVFKACIEIVENNSNIDVQFYTIGKKIGELVEKRGFKVYKKVYDAIDKVSAQTANEIANELSNLFVNQEFDSVKIVFNEFVNAAVQNVKVENFLPLKFDLEPQKFKTDYIFEPSKEEIVGKIIPMWLNTKFLQTMADSSAGEHGARMTSMNKATDNATELIKELNLSYNKVRQASITNEIIEIVSGASVAK